MSPTYPASTMPQPMCPPPSLPSSYQHSGQGPPGASTAAGNPSLPLPPISPIAPSHLHHLRHSHDQYSRAQHPAASSLQQLPPPLSHHPPPGGHHPPPVSHQHQNQHQLRPQLQLNHAPSQPGPQPTPSSPLTKPERKPGPPPPTAAVVPSSKTPDAKSVLASVAKTDDATGRKYQLDVVQQPRRARMCGFGDKDRRPITPPPCVRLIVRDPATGREINCNDIDHTMFVLNVDLWSADGAREVNLVRSSASPASSVTQSTTSPPEHSPDRSLGYYSMQAVAASRDTTAYTQQSVGYTQEYQVSPRYSSSSYAPAGNYMPSQKYLDHPSAYQHEPSTAAHPRSGSTPSATQTRGMFTRNLIGSVAVSAFRLNDTTDEPGVWFVLQDLSVRTEGNFRLRFSFVDVSPRVAQPADGSVPKINTGRAPTLASCFSEPFQVFSAKKFPGVCESTPLSKTFATQGIKIPIRKDASGKDEEGDAYMD